MPLIEEIVGAPPGADQPSSAATRAVASARATARVPGTSNDVQNDEPLGDWSEPKGLSSLETKQMAVLREKYAGRGGGCFGGRSGGVSGAGEKSGSSESQKTERCLKQAQEAMDAEFMARPMGPDSNSNSNAAAASATAKIRACPSCRGERVTRHEYNHRMMEKMCVTCDGEGVLGNGRVVGGDGDGDEKEKEKDNKNDENDENELASDPTNDASPFFPGHGLRRRLGVLHRDAKRLDNQVQKYKDEMKIAQARVDADGDVPSGEEQVRVVFPKSRHAVYRPCFSTLLVMYVAVASTGNTYLYWQFLQIYHK